ncbi:PREDICTED: uncharacterized protein LOC109173812 [Ipomoea nil]|uniref:uncharacterized protein LOC109173812 n=1 Tax=Ipomoea nil TaxID=35883 RepID=UPI00090194BD|nr:PREDICTED: uncharacterized protein LOC109173812 [Ipomoea nil]
MIRRGVPTRGRTRQVRLSINVSPIQNIVVNAYVLCDSDTWFQDGYLQLNGSDVPIDLIRLDMQDFDVILGLDWSGMLVSKVSLKVIYALKAKKELRKGCSGFLTYVDTHPKEVELDDIPIVKEFSDVFLEHLIGLPPNREIEFKIEVPGTTPISKAPYCMSPSELR